jgi:hypothetical protein
MTTPKRSKLATKAPTRQLYERTCAHCGRDFGKTGVLPYNACIHWEAGVFSLTCGQTCRNVLGLKTHRVEN